VGAGLDERRVASACVRESCCDQARRDTAVAVLFRDEHARDRPRRPFVDGLHDARAQQTAVLGTRRER